MDCPTCDSNFDSEHAVKIHHSKAHGESIAGVLVSCHVCGESIRKAPSRVEGVERHFCSDTCKSEGYNQQVALECDHCGDTFTRRPSRIERAERHYCSTECKGKAYRTRQTASCMNCGAEINCRKSRAERYENLYCSEECQNQHMRGAADPKWKGGATIHETLLRHLGGVSWKQIRRSLQESRPLTCERCGSDESAGGRALQLHHIVPVMAGGSHHRENLMFLCHSCHRKADTYMTEVLTYPLSDLIEQYAD